MVCFTVKDKFDFLNEFLGHYALNFNCIREGYRVVPLKNKLNKYIENSFILVKIEIKTVTI